MISSMTGYGSGEKEDDRQRVNIEIKTVNSRYAEVKVKLPHKMAVFEDKIIKIVKEKLARGKIEIYLKHRENQASRKTMKIDKDLALAYYDVLKDLSKAMDKSALISPLDLLELPQVMEAREDLEDKDALWKLVESALKQALDQVKLMRRQEGENLKDDVLARTQTLMKLCQEVRQMSVENLGLYKEKLEERLEKILEDQAVDQDKLASELAVYADKSDITEEVVRLESHFTLLRQTLDTEEVVGRKLDFLVQEMNREVNTIGSKSHLTQISQRVVDMKSEIEKIREQVQNME